LVGGIHSPLLHWLGVLPMLSALMGARRAAWGWLLCGFVVLAGLATADAQGIVVPNYLDLAPDHLTRYVQRGIDVGSWLAVLLTIALLYEGYTGQQTLTLAAQNEQLESEIEQRRRAEERTHYLAYYDDLTGLPNRRLFKEQLTRSMTASRRRDWLIAVLYLDLDGFKQVNDTRGHDLGDVLLQAVSERLQGCIRETDSIARGGDENVHVVSRLGGDEFTILLDSIKDYREAALVAQRILHSIEQPFPLDGQDVFISASIGIAVHPDAGQDMHELLQHADLAMYHAKKKGKNNFQFYRREMNEEIIRRTTLMHDLRKAIEEEELELHYQPIVDASTQEIVSVEALVRWQHPQRGLLPPGEFIELAEETRLIVPLGKWILRSAVRRFEEWRREGIAPARMAVNVSGVEFCFGDIVETVLREERIDPRSLVIEVTESAMMLDEEETSRALEQLSRLGVTIALDDFGTGYSSLSYVKRFPVNLLKIDRSFVQEIEEEPEAQAIATAIIAMAHQLDLVVVAEGVETAAQREFLVRHGCDELQGYLFGRPVVAKEIARILRGQDAVVDFGEDPNG
jgi:diguanylate cyclase (GGDEF)-like protein